MKVLASAAAAGLCFFGSAGAQPLVTGYERFHAATPDADGGALLYSELGCVNCHGGGPGLPDRRGPVLGGLKSRIQADWVPQFLANPQQAKSGTTMPGLFDGGTEAEKAARVEAVTHYLMSLKPIGPAPKAKTPRHANAERGSARFHQVGCVACHAPSSDFHPAAGPPRAEDFSSRPVPFPDLKAKYSLLSLATFLEAPDRVRTDGRMPHLGLDAEDALDIACHLLDYRPSDPREAPGLKAFAIDADLARSGAELVAKMNCAACHELTAKNPPPPDGIPIRSIESGCLSAESAAGLPRYSLDPNQRASLVQYLKHAGDATRPATEVADLTLKAFNCLACHDRDGRGGPDAARDRYFTGDEAIAAAGRLAPPLTGIGKKLRPEWLSGVFKGEGRVRPYVMTRMPSYAGHADFLTKLLTEADRRDLPPLAEGDVEAGHRLAGVQGGVNCVTCHVWGDKPALGIQALDISNLDRRLDPAWFRDYLLNPAAYRPGTLMPPLWPGGRSLVGDILGGDTEKQIASLWAYIEKGEGLPAGYPDHVSGAYELVPGDRAILQRTFLNEVGTHAILAGFPGGVNLAYDGEQGRPALAWRGRFFDAYSTWFVRAAPFEDPLEKEVHLWPRPSGSGSGGFRGYRLDSGGNPTFLITLDGVPVEDRYQVRDGKLHRTVAWPAGTVEPVWQHPEGLGVETAPSAAPQQRTFIYSWK